MKVDEKLYRIKLDNCTVWSIDSKAELEAAKADLNQLSFVQLHNVEYVEADNYYAIAEADYVITEEQLIELALSNKRYTVTQTLNVSLDISKQLIELAEKPVTLTMANNDGATYNNKCEVHMPGNTLAFYNEMLLLEDACTDSLQKQLNAGWRIIAACPQPDQRRPDYILGRFNPTYEADNEAKRN